VNNNRLLIGKEYPNWNIVVGTKASKVEINAANELQHFLHEVLGVIFPIITDNQDSKNHEIIVGCNNRIEKLGLTIPWQELGDEGFIIKTYKENLIIVGGKLRGTLYGVYTFLEDYAGCRWFSSTVSRIPKKEYLDLYGIDDKQIPALEYRETFYFDAFDGDWAARNKSNGHFAKLEEKHGGKIKYSHFVHTFNSLVPVEEYFDSHPEYFSEINGKRISKRTQLCLTNPDVLKIAINRVREWIEEEPDVKIISISQNDWYNPCECKNCRIIDEKEGSHSGTLIHFVNKIAEVIEKDYPDKFIDTLAYQYTRKPPKYVRPRKNVIVRLCSIECCFSHPLETCREVCYRFVDKVEPGSSFAKDLEGWAKICDRLYVWDYVTNFSHYLLPFPNFHVLQPNIKYLINNNVVGIFEEGNYEIGGGGEFAELRAYVIAKLLWNPDYDVNLAINEFLTGYYGMAAPAIREYFDMIHKKVIDENIHLSIYDPPINEYLTPDIIEKANKLFDRAEMLADNAEILERVKIARLPIKFVNLAVMEKDVPEKEKLIDEFFEEIKQYGITRIKEGRDLEFSKRMMLSREYY